MTDTTHTGSPDTRDPKDRSGPPQRDEDEVSKAAFDAGKAAAQNRWLLLTVGIVTVLAGIAALAMPFIASLTAALLVGWVLIISGAVGLFTAFRRHEGWHIAASFALSVVSILGGILMIAQPIAGIFALTTVLIAYFAASGILRLYYGARSWGDGGGWMMATGALSFLLALLLWFGLPFNAAWVPGVFLGVDLLMWGAVQISLALRAGRAPERADA